MRIFTKNFVRNMSKLSSKNFTVDSSYLKERKSDRVSDRDKFEIIELCKCPGIRDRKKFEIEDSRFYCILKKTVFSV